MVVEATGKSTTHLTTRTTAGVTRNATGTDVWRVSDNTLTIKTRK